MEKPEGAVGKYAKPVGKQPVAVPMLSPSEVPEWSDDTLRMLERLKPNHRVFVEWMATGSSATEAYRKAYGDVESASVCACQLLRDTPGVKEAVSACLKDRNFGAKCDREWKLLRLKELVEVCRNSPWPQDRATLARALVDMARLQGELVDKKEVTHNGLSQRSGVSVFISQIVAEAKGLDPGPASADSQQTGQPVVVVTGAAVGADQRATSGSLAE